MLISLIINGENTQGARIQVKMHSRVKQTYWQWGIIVAVSGNLSRNLNHRNQEIGLMEAEMLINLSQAQC